MYQSTKVKPYVYRGTHKVTGEYYIGYRELNVKFGRTSDIDLPKYKTSSRKVKCQFDEYEWIILAEFEDGNDAYDFEQQLISQNWGDPLMINANCRINSTNRFKRKRGFTHSAETKAKISLSHTGKVRPPLSQEHKDKVSNSLKGHVHSDETKAKIGAKSKGRYVSPETKAKHSAYKATPESREKRSKRMAGVKRGPYKKRSVPVNNSAA